MYCGFCRACSRFCRHCDDSALKIKELSVKQSTNFAENIRGLRHIFAVDSSLLREFRRNPSGTVRAQSLDFSMQKDGGEILFSEYLDGISNHTKQIVIQSIAGQKDERIKFPEHGDETAEDEDWIDDVGGANPVAAQANVSVSALILLDAVASHSTMGLGPKGPCGEPLDRARIYLKDNALSPDLSNTLKERGLNAFRQATLLKHLTWKTNQSGGAAGEGHPVLVTYKNLRINLTISHANGKCELVRADLMR